jgi:cytochrome c-type biogenesis protein CcmH
MSTFVVVAVLLTLSVLALLLVPLLFKERKPYVGSASELSIAVLRDQLSDLESQRKAGLLDPQLFVEEQAELERRALEDTTTARSTTSYSSSRKMIIVVAIGVIVPALTLGLYFFLGSPDTLKAKPAADPTGNHALSPQQIQSMADKLAERLQSNPDDGEGWLILGRSYTTLGRYPEAAAALGRATALLPPNPNLLADYADVVAMAQGRRLAGEPEKIIARALSINPRHIKSLALAGSASFERGDYGNAVQTWRTILTLVPPDSNVAQTIGTSIADAERRLGIAGVPSVSAPASPQVASVAASVSGTVVLAPELVGKMPANGTLFIFARAVDGSRVPLAMSRVNPIKLPYAFTLNDSMSMAPNVRLSSAKSVVIGARISLAGEALAKPGDYEGFSAPVKVGAEGITVTIGAIVK